MKKAEVDEGFFLNRVFRVPDFESVASKFSMFKNCDRSSFKNFPQIYRDLKFF